VGDTTVGLLKLCAPQIPGPRVRTLAQEGATSPELLDPAVARSGKNASKRRAIRRLAVRGQHELDR
jgi:hypothetical protein